MSFKIIRNDITKMNTDAIVNTANSEVRVGDGCDMAIYNAAGKEKLLAYRKENIGEIPEGEAFLTPGFDLQAKYIIHAVSPLFVNGNNDEENKLRSCYRKSLELAVQNGIKSIAFPLISTGCYGYPKEEGMRIAIDEISAFLLNNDLEVYLVVFDRKSTSLDEKIYPDLDQYIDQNYVRNKGVEAMPMASRASEPVHAMPVAYLSDESDLECSAEKCCECIYEDEYNLDYEELQIEKKLKERMEHMSDTFSQYLMYLIQERNMENADVYKRAIVDKKIFSKLKNNIDYQPQKMTALCLCVGAKLNLDETKDLLSRAGYALSPCSKTDIIFSYFIENEIYDMIEIDIQLEEHGLPCIIS